MSADTQRALDEAIAAHLLDEMTAPMVSGYVLLVAGQNFDDLGAEDEDGQHRYLFAVPEGQSSFATLGLARMLTLKWDAWGTLRDDD
jgi:hypothetical protein